MDVHKEGEAAVEQPESTGSSTREEETLVVLETESVEKKRLTSACLATGC